MSTTSGMRVAIRIKYRDAQASPTPRRQESLSEPIITYGRYGYLKDDVSDMPKQYEETDFYHGVT